MYVCTVCERGFKFSNDLERHIVSIHEVFITVIISII